MSPFTPSLPTCHPERSGMPAKRAFRVVEGPALSLPKGSLPSIRSLWERMVAARKLAAAILREIFDESAYERFLEQHDLPSTAAAYSQFCCERETIKVGPTKCC